MDAKEIFCGNCTAKLNNEIQKCNLCGSELKDIRFSFHESIEIYDNIRYKEKVGTGKSSLKLDCFDGYEESSNGEMVYKKRVIDKKRNWYLEYVITLKGKIIRFCNEKLTSHQGRGSAKFKYKK